MSRAVCPTVNLPGAAQPTKNFIGKRETLISNFHLRKRDGAKVHSFFFGVTSYIFLEKRDVNVCDLLPGSI
jgi:hypothetical protein